MNKIANEKGNIEMPESLRNQEHSTGKQPLDEFYPNLRPGTLKTAPGLEGYLMELDQLEASILSLEEEIQEREARRQGQEPGSFYRKLNEKIMRGLLSEYKRKQAKAGYLMSTIDEITGEKKPSASGKGVTDDERERAKQYPIEHLVESKRGMARCLSGTLEDRNASMQTTGNYAYCHACGFKADVITLYMKVRGVSFVDAVRAMQ